MLLRWIAPYSGRFISFQFGDVDNSNGGGGPFLDANGMKKVPHPPNSPDSALTDFRFFGEIKED
jgi:hypothetical protein